MVPTRELQGSEKIEVGATKQKRRIMMWSGGLRVIMTLKDIVLTKAWKSYLFRRLGTGSALDFASSAEVLS